MRANGEHSIPNLLTLKNFVNFDCSAWRAAVGSRRNEPAKVFQVCLASRGGEESRRDGRHRRIGCHALPAYAQGITGMHRTKRVGGPRRQASAAARAWGMCGAASTWPGVARRRTFGTAASGARTASLLSPNILASHSPAWRGWINHSFAGLVVTPQASGNCDDGSRKLQPTRSLSSD